MKDTGEIPKENEGSENRFVERLKSQSLGALPPEWKEEILAIEPGHQANRSFPHILTGWLSEWFPKPVLVPLLAVWGVIMVLYGMNRTERGADAGLPNNLAGTESLKPEPVVVGPSLWIERERLLALGEMPWSFEP